MSALLGRLGGWCARHGGTVLALWLVAAGALTTAVLVFGGPVGDDVTLPGSDYEVARELAEEGFGPGYGHGATVNVVLHSPRGSLTEPGRRRAVERVMGGIAGVRYVKEVQTPYRPGGLSEDERTGLITVLVDGHDASRTVAIAEELAAAAEPVRRLGIEAVPQDRSTPGDRGIETGVVELAGVGIALLILVAGFGTLVAALVPIFAALVSVTVGLRVIGLLGHVTDTTALASLLATVVGLGVGVDYALFLVSRHRRLLAEGVPVTDSVGRTAASSGGAVVLAGGTVIIALGALVFGGMPQIGTFGLATGVSVLCAVLTSITLVPALLGLLGHRINALPVPLFGPRRGRRGTSHRQGSPGAPGWARLGRWVVRRPWTVLTATLAVLAALALPGLGLKIGVLDPGHSAEGSSGRRAFELMERGFGAGSTDPILVVAEVGRRITNVGDPVVRDLQQRIAGTEGIRQVLPAKIDTSGMEVLVPAVTEYSPGDPGAARVVRAVRAIDMPWMDVHVGGRVAATPDIIDRVGGRTPLVIALAVLLGALLLLLAFRAPVLALTAALMNLISLGVAFGALALVFSFGWGTGVIGLDAPAADGVPVAGTPFFPVPVEAHIPVMLFAMLFGLTMDYEVFLLTAVRRAFRRTGDTRRAIAEGLGSTGRVTTSAALIMVAVLTVLVAHPDAAVKYFGVGMAVAVAVDAMIIRGLLVPASMALLGRLNWWCPRALARVLPPVSGHDGEEARRPEPAPAGVPVGS